MSTEYCSVCEELAGHIQAPGGVVYRDAWWEVAHHTGAWTDPGELIVKARRHVASMSALTSAEAASLGPSPSAAVGAIERVVRPERVYVASYNERVRHVHFFLLPRTDEPPCRPRPVRCLPSRPKSAPKVADRVPTPRRRPGRTAAARIRSDDAWKPLST